MPRAIAVNYVGPLYSKGSLLLCHKDNAGSFKTAEDLNSPGRHLLGHRRRERGAAHPAAVPEGEGDHHHRPGLARRRAGARQARRRVDQRRQRRDPVRQAQRELGHVIDPEQAARPAPEYLGDPLRRPRSGSSFLDFYGAFLIINGEIERLFKFHMEKLGAA